MFGIYDYGEIQTTLSSSILLSLLSGLGAIAAAVMSSSDSAILGSSSMFTQHIYRRLRVLTLDASSDSSQTVYILSHLSSHLSCHYLLATAALFLFQPSTTELGIVLKLAIIVVGALSALVALLTPSLTIYGLFILAADIVFVAVLPQLICVLYIPVCNGYGGLIGELSVKHLAL